MRRDPYSFTVADQAQAKAPRFVTAIVYDVDSLYITSHAGIANVPGTVIDGALSEPTITSQQLNPETAAAEIGSASFGLVDLGEQFSQEVRERLADGAGLRGRLARFYLGYAGMGFEDFVLIGTQTVHGCQFTDGKYQVACLDIQRTMRADIFDVVETTLAASVGVADVTITVTSTEGLQLVAHGPGWSDAPNATVGYVQIRSEIIRYTGILGNELQGCTRGALGTTAAAYAVDASMPADRREKVSEYVYLEMPAVKLAYALLTGQLWGSANTLPPGWHLGIPASLVTDEDFTGIGADLWNPADDTSGFIVRFEGLKATDGKRFLEKEIGLLIGAYMPVYADGSLGLRRMIRLSDDAATTLTLDESNSVQVGTLVHDMESMHNAFVVNWSWNGSEFRRATAYVDTQSRAVHGRAPTLSLSFKGLYGGRHTDGIIFQMLDMLRDRFAGPPLRMEVRVLHALNRIEIGDVVRVRYRNVRDYSKYLAVGSTSIDRAFEVQNISTDHKSGMVTLQLFGSTSDPSVSAPTGGANALPDAWYTSEGTALSAVPGIVITGDHMTAAANPLVGTASQADAGSIYYHDGNLTIDAGVTLTIRNNIQLRVRGFLQINGVIDGKGGGHPGVADDGRVLAIPDVMDTSPDGPFTADSIPGIPGLVGTVRGYDGVCSVARLQANLYVSTQPPHLTTGKYPAAPRLLLSVTDGRLSGVIADMRGAGGGPGGRVTNAFDEPVEALGGAGAAGGAGLSIITRGMAFGAGGYIDLSGLDTVVPPAHTIPWLFGATLTRYPGAGAGGGPGVLYVLLDGSAFSLPDFTGSKFRSRAGISPQPAGVNALPRYRWVLYSSHRLSVPDVESPMMGFPDLEFLANNGKDYSGSAVAVQYIPSPETAVPDPGGDAPPPVTALTTEAVEQGIHVTLELPPLESFDVVQLYASADNNRENAAKVAEGLFDITTVRVPDGAFRYFWARTKKGRLTSDFFPVAADAGVPGQALGGMRTAGPLELYGTTVKKKAGTSSAWDASFYSQETYAGGAFVSFQPASLGSQFIIGLNSDPESANNYESIDFGWMVLPDGRTQIYESGTMVQEITAPPWALTTVLEVRYDGQLVRFFRDGVLIRTTPKRDGVYFVDSSFYNAGASAKSIKYGPLTTAPSIPWVARGNCEAAATTAKKVGGAAAWDSDVYSFEAYRNGAFVSFQCDQVNASLMVGLNTDPLTDSNYTSLDFAWQAKPDGTADIYEGGVGVLVALPYTTTSVFAIAYDGKAVRYLLNGTLVREVPAPDRTFHMDSAFLTPGGAIRNLTFTPFGTATPVPFLARGSVSVSDTTAQKVGGVNGWDGDFVSINGYAVCFVEFKPSQSTTNLMVGLNSDPYSSMSYESLDAAWYCSAGTLHIYENGAPVSNQGPYTPSTVLAITYDGANVRYYRDSVLQWTTALAGRTMYADGAFASPNSSINSLRFGPGTTLTQVDTPQLRPNATTDVLAEAQNSDVIVIPVGGVGQNDVDLLTLVFTPTAGGEAKITASCSLTVTDPGGAGGRAYIQLVVDSTVLAQVTGAGGGGATPEALPMPISLTVKTNVNSNVPYTARLRAQMRDGSTSKPAPAVNISQRILRVEVNKR